MPSHPDTQDAQQDHIERLFLGIPEDAVLPQVVGARKQWAEQMVQKARRASGDETIGVAMARIGNKQIRLPEPIDDEPGVDPVPEPYVPGQKSGTGTVNGAPPTGAPNLNVGYVDTEPVVVATLDTSQLERLPSWVEGLDARIVDRPEAEIIPSSYPITSPEPDRPDRLGAAGNDGSVFEASLSSGVTLALLAGGFGTAYYLFGEDGG